MNIGATPKPEDYLSTLLATTEKQNLNEEENSVTTTGNQAATAAEDEADFTREAELIMDNQFQELRDEEHRQDTQATDNSWFIQNMAFKA